jgi:hypothetical protein
MPNGLHAALRGFRIVVSGTLARECTTGGVFCFHLSEAVALKEWAPWQCCTSLSKDIVGLHEEELEEGHTLIGIGMTYNIIDLTWHVLRYNWPAPTW